MSYINIFGGQTIQPAIVSYLNVTPFIANITLSWASQFQDTNNVVASTMDLNPTVGGLSVTMPDATQTSVGQFVTFNNYGSQSVNILDNTGGLITAISAGNIFYIYLIDNTTVAGTWRTIPFGIGIGTVVTSVGAVSANPTALTITSSTTNPITNTGTFTFTPSTDLDALSAFAAGTGYAVRTGAGTWSLRTFVAGTGITLTDPDGVVGNTQIAVNANLTLTQLQVGNLNLTANTISSTNANGAINIIPNGTGSVLLGSNGAPVTIDTNDNITNVHNLTSGGTVTAATLVAGNLSLTANTISSTAGVINVTPFAGQSLTLGSNATPFTIDTNNNVTNVATLTATTLIGGNINITGGTISNAAAGIIIKPSAGNPLRLGSDIIPVQIDGSSNVTGVNSLTSSGTVTATNTPKAWIYFNGTTGAIIKSVGAIAAVTVTAAGNYTINWNVVFTDNIYAVFVTTDDTGVELSAGIGTRTTTTTQILVRNSASALTTANCSVTILD